MRLSPDGRRLDDRRRVLLQNLHAVLDIGPVKIGQGLLEVVGDAAVVHHEAVSLFGLRAVLLVGEPAVHTGDGLEEAMLPQRAIQVEHLLRWGVEPREQHVHHDQDLRLALGVDECVGDLIVVQFPGDLELGAVVVRGRDDGVCTQAEAPQRSV